MHISSARAMLISQEATFAPQPKRSDRKPMAAAAADNHGALAEITDTAGGIFHGEAVQEGKPVAGVGLRGEGALPRAHEVSHIILAQLLAEVGMTHKALSVHHADHIGGCFRIQLKTSVLFAVPDCHTHSLLFFG